MRLLRSGTSAPPPPAARVRTLHTSQQRPPAGAPPAALHRWSAGGQPQKPPPGWIPLEIESGGRRAAAFAAEENHLGTEREYSTDLRPHPFSSAAQTLDRASPGGRPILDSITESALCGWIGVILLPLSLTIRIMITLCH